MRLVSSDELRARASVLDQQIEELGDLIALKKEQVENLDDLTVKVETIFALKGPGLTLIGMLKLRSEQLATEERELASLEADFDEYGASADNYSSEFGMF